MLEITIWIIIIAYISIGIELTGFHVPSVASTVNIWNPKKEILNHYSERFRSLFLVNKVKKILYFVFPLLIVYLTFFFPFILLWWESELTSSFVFEPTTLSYIIAIGLIIGGRLITFLSVLTIRKENKQKSTSFKLHTDSLFDISRNPGLVGMYVFFVGLWFALPSIYFFFAILFYMAYMHFKVLMEEDFLSNKYGTPYLDYFKQTKRYLI